MLLSVQAGDGAIIQRGEIHVNDHQGTDGFHTQPRVQVSVEQALGTEALEQTVATWVGENFLKKLCNPLAKFCLQLRKAIFSVS